MKQTQSLISPWENIPAEIRICKIMKLNLVEYQTKAEKAGGIVEKDSWLAGQIVASFEYLKERMKDLRISKETLRENGVDFDAFKKLYFSVA